MAEPEREAVLDPDTKLCIRPYEADQPQIEATRADRLPRVRLYRPADPLVVLGRGSKAASELNVEACLADGVAVARRPGGGCAVLLDPGNLVVSVTLPCDGIGGNTQRFAALSEWMIRCLAACGIPGVTHDGISDLVLGEHKISGSCIRQWRDAVYYAATLLVEPDMVAMSRYLAHPPREPAYRRGRSHAEFCRALAEHQPGLTTGTLLARFHAITAEMPPPSV